MYYNRSDNRVKKQRGFRVDILAGLIMSVMIAFAGQAFSQAKGGGGAALPGDNKQIVTGTTAPCASTTVDTGSVVSVTSTVNTDDVTEYTLGMFGLRGTLTNCSTSLQAYYVEFSEAPRTTVDTLGQPNCTISWGVGDFLMKSGDKRGWSFGINPTIATSTDVSDCLGTHTVAVRVIDRTTGVLLQSTSATYEVVLK